ncbi:multidrug effflux MFS transporter [Acinetobacter sp. CAAS 2-6]|uniref:multidrug effflux MFS transporter n=1 Tax=Acinetobacter sp. CAAS 2-6 TaxID=3016358 RepID=UPI002DD6769D|nr:multidrug effflux MFS transporter [Acinetobacter sp. CAAS 2-6]
MNIEKSDTSTGYSSSWIMLLALLTALGPLSIDMYLPALPQMASDFGTTTQQVANTLPAYFLGLAVGQLVYGPISDRIGRKKPLYFGLILYSLASLLCVLAESEWSLILARVLQALGGCVGVVMARAAIRDRLDLSQSAHAFASMMIVMGLAPILAPTIGAWILAFFSWHAVFVVLAMMGLVCLGCVHFFFKETLPADRRLKLNFSQVARLYMTILLDRSFRLPMLAGCFSGAVLFSYISSASSILMDGYHLSQQQFAYAFGINAFGIMLLSFINKRLAGHLGVLQRLCVGVLIQLLGAVILFAVGLQWLHSFVGVMVGMFMAVAGIGFTGPNATALAMSQQGARAGTASAIMGSLQFGCGLLGGVLLNILSWNAVLNVAVIMLIFLAIGGIAISALIRDQHLQSTI